MKKKKKRFYIEKLKKKTDGIESFRRRVTDVVITWKTKKKYSLFVFVLLCVATDIKYVLFTSF